MTRDEALAAIAEALDPLTPDRFFAEVLGREVTAVPGDPACSRARLLGPDPKAAVLGGWATLPARFGIHGEGASGPPPPREGVDGPAAFDRLIAAYHAAGYTTHLPDMGDLSPALRRLLAAFELMTHQPAKASLFWSRPGNRAPVHYDDRDNITVQLVGAKRWFVSTEQPSLHNPWRDVAEAPRPLGAHRVIEGRPGDLLFIPRGLRHTVETLEESLHLSITLAPVTVREAIVAALDHLSDYDRALRDTALARADRLGPDLPAVQAAVVAGLERLLAQARTAAFLGSALQRRASRFVGELPKLPPSAVPPDLSPATMLAHAPGAMATMLATPEQIDFALPGQHLTVHRAAEQALRFAAATPRFRAGDLPGLSDELRVALARRLLESGFLITERTAGYTHAPHPGTRPG